MSCQTPLEELAQGLTLSPPLQKGVDQRAAIQDLQSMLHALGFGSVLQWSKYGADGDYGAATTAAVKQFCQQNGFASTGEIVTPTIAQKLLQRYNALDELQQLNDDLQADKIAQCYYQGSSATVAVCALQTLLNEVGLGQVLQWEKYGADGDYGPATARALAQFAQQHSLQSDGSQLTVALAQRIIEILAPYYGPQWATTNVLASQAAQDLQLTVFTDTHFIGKKVVANKSFLPALNKINQYAHQNNVKVYVTSSFRPTTVVKGAIVKPATFSNHLVGHAIDMNLVYGPEATFCNSRVLAQAVLPPPVDAFIQAIRQDPGLRWGGDFRVRDVVHIDDNTYHQDKEQWLASYEAIQQQLLQGHFV
ncbi:MAG: peptidoglycan-binding protein [Bacteroidota bacterium]